MERRRRRADSGMLRNLSGRQAAWSYPHKKPENAQPVLVSECAKCIDGMSNFHSQIVQQYLKYAIIEWLEVSMSWKNGVKIRSSARLSPVTDLRSLEQF
jgi:hypothetical protein